MTDEHATPPDRLTRRRFLVGAGAILAGGVTAAVAARRATASVGVPSVPLGTQPTYLPARQHAWSRWLHRDEYGNPLAPRYDRLLFFDVRGRPTPAYARLLESRLRTLERHFRWGPDGLLFTVSYGPEYFTRVLGVLAPLARATSLSSFESPAIDGYHLCMHLACDDEARLADIEAALVMGHTLRGVDGSLSLTPILIWRETRTGFTGRGLPAAHQHVHGIPAGGPVPAGAPLFMGFKSGLKKNQATEDDVTIPAGEFAQGTTMQVSYMRLELDPWYGGLSARERVALMYSPQTTVEAATKFTTDASGNPGAITQAITRYGVVGHAQASAQARRHNRPMIIRRDFDTVDGGYAGLHFVSVQRSIEDFVATRNAMNATGAHNINRQITATANNGINAFISVRRRANYIMPSRRDRSFPLLSSH
jgi:dye decolorizing peroxidase